MSLPRNIYLLKRHYCQIGIFNAGFKKLAFLERHNIENFDLALSQQLKKIWHFMDIFKDH